MRRGAAFSNEIVVGLAVREVPYLVGRGHLYTLELQMVDGAIDCGRKERSEKNTEL